MSHVFISYKRENFKERDIVVEALKKANISRWYDTDIEFSEDWFEAINQNLERAYAVVVIVTEASLDSHYVTYEWSWAKGHGLEIIPLQFGKIRSDQETHPLRMLRLQAEPCENEVPERVIEKLLKLQTESPLVRYINLRINDITMPLRILAGFSLWLYPFERSNQVNFDTLHLLIEKASQEAERLYHETLPNFWLSSAHAFSVKHRRLYKELDEQIHDFGLLLANLATAILNSNGLYDVSKEVAEVNKYRAEVIEPLFSHFSVNDWRLQSVIAFSSILQDISGNTLIDRDNIYKLTFPMMAQHLLSSFLSEEDAKSIWEIIKQLAGKNLFLD